MRMEDQYNFEGEVDADCVMGGAVPSSIRGFSRFLRLLHKRAPDLLPPWWSAAKEHACKQAGMQRGGGGGGADVWESLRGAPEKADFIEHYADPRMPMQLRLFAEAIYGSGPGGQSGAEMLAVMAGAEVGGEEAQVKVFDTRALLAELMGRS